MTTVSELVRDVLSSVATETDGMTVAKWIDNRYKEMVAKVRFKSLRTVGELSIPGIYDTGTLAVARGATAVTGTGTAWQTNIGAGDQQYWYIRALSAWYKIASVGGELDITLASAFAEDDQTTATFDAVKRYHPLNSNARIIGTVVHTRLRREIDVLSLTELDIVAPGRILVGVPPRYLALVGVDTSNNLMAEVYPPPAESEILHYIYYNIPSALTLASTIPPQIDPYTLKEGVLSDLYRLEKTRALRKGNVEAAALWRNEEKAQMTIWTKAIADAIRSDRGTDDITFILQTTPRHDRRSRDIRIARDQVYYDWNYPG